MQLPPLISRSKFLFSSLFCLASFHDMKPLVLLGAGGFALEAANWAFDAGFSVHAMFDESFEIPQGPVVRIPILSEIRSFDNRYCFLPAVGNIKTRDHLLKRAMFETEMVPTEPVIHPSAVVSKFAKVAYGSIVCPQAVVSPGVEIEAYALLNLGCTVGHGTKIGLNVNIAPGANISGNVEIGSRVYIGSNAFIRENITIGKGATIGAGAVVVKDVPENTVVVGNPARPLKGKSHGD